MEISFHLKNPYAAETSHVRTTGSRMAETARQEVAFDNSRALTTALHNTPELREDVVRRASELVGDVSYPPPETIRMISHLLAIQLQGDSEPQ